MSYCYAFRPAAQAYQGRLRLVDDQGAETVRPFITPSSMRL